MPASASTDFDDARWLLDRRKGQNHRSAGYQRAMRYSADLSQTVTFAGTRSTDRNAQVEYRGSATISAPDVPALKVEACLVASSDPRSGLIVWRGRVVAENNGSLLAFASSASIQLHVAGRTGDMTILSLGEAASEIAGCGQPPF
jgi:hypothetical protein